MIKSIIKFFIPNILVKKRRGYIENKAYKQKLQRIKEYRLIKSPQDYFPIAAHVCDATWNTMYTPEIYDIAKERQLIAKFPSFEFYLMKDSIINIESDIFLTEKGAWWDKFNEEDFMTLCTPADRNVISYTRDTVNILPADHVEIIKGKVISLTGVWSYAWSHCMFEFITRLFMAGECGLLDDEVTLLTNDYNDENIEYIICNYLKQFPKVKRQIAKPYIDYKCEELLAIRCTGTNYNEAKVYWDYRLVIPEIVTNKLHQYISEPLIKKIKDNPTKHKKIYLSRHTNRKLINTEEIEEFFRNEGFYFVEGFELTLEEKVDLFYHAEIIVGLHSSAWQNIIFCDQAKCLMLVNNRYVTEMLFYTMAKENVSRWINVCGYDETDDRRSDFTIPLIKIQNAYKELIK